MLRLPKALRWFHGRWRQRRDTALDRRRCCLKCSLRRLLQGIACPTRCSSRPVDVQPRCLLRFKGHFTGSKLNWAHAPFEDGILLLRWPSKSLALDNVQLDVALRAPLKIHMLRHRESRCISSHWQRTMDSHPWMPSVCGAISPAFPEAKTGVGKLLLFVGPVHQL